MIVQSAPASAASRSDQAGDDLGSRMECAAQQLQCKTQPAGGARAGRIGNAPADRRFGELGKTRDRIIEAAAAPPESRPSARAEDRGGATGTGERIVDVGHDRERAFGKARISVDASTRASATQSFGASYDFATCRFAEREAKRREHAARRRRWYCCHPSRS